LNVDPETLSLRAEPGKSIEWGANFRFGELISFRHLAGTLLALKLKAVDNDSPLSAERTIPVTIDQSYPCIKAPPRIMIDGDLGEWRALNLAFDSKPLVLGNSQAWRGPGDASLSFTLAYDDQYVYFAGRVADDALQGGDDFELRLDPRPLDVRSTD